MKNLIIPALCFCAIGFAQEQESSPNPIDDQFENLISNSNNFQEYKVVKETDLDKLKENTATYILQLDNQIASLEASVAAEKQAQKPLQDELTAANANVAELDAQKDSIAVLGLALDKNVYSIIVWSIVGLLAIALISVILQYRKSNAVTQQARAELDTAEKELEELRRKSIEEKQRLGRQLQDERNKLSRLRTAN
ncbi:hypothetical protein SAMN05192588_0061 [Nonlabens sp. Hel1_33_55]|uniref:hypothetical protein n=1 Tax=Nonlabens sp. Hel1_33_55 TaxID=1336802 RepID=UPI000875C3B2|nr:hypothetical protein [Nonlabens sp. Hel1_33_55]SCX87872.1 hypothetical protein SAMN05192588_0061 [Nonlabens sp. Hel1_33_55]